MNFFTLTNHNDLSNFGDYHYQIPAINNSNENHQLGAFEKDFDMPIINIYIVNYPQNTSVYQYYWYPQPNVATNQPCYYPQYNQMQFFQEQPILPYFNQSFMQDIRPIKMHENSKKDKKHDHHKDHEKKKEKGQKSKKTKTAKKAKPLSFLYTAGRHLEGIIHYLTNKTGGDVCANGTINIEGSSNQNGGKDAKHLCDFSNLGRSSMWSPDNEQNANILFDFKDRRIKLTYYSLQTPIQRTSDYPRYWKVECSNDLVSWKIVDTQNDVESMNSNNVCNTFRCKNQQKDFFRYIKITSTGPCWSNKDRYYFDISAVEFFGFLKE